MRDCHSIVGLYTYQNRVPFAPSLRWVSCKERDRLPHEGANFHSSFVHYPIYPNRKIGMIERGGRPIARVAPMGAGAPSRGEAVATDCATRSVTIRMAAP